MQHLGNHNPATGDVFRRGSGRRRMALTGTGVAGAALAISLVQLGSPATSVSAASCDGGACNRGGYAARVTGARLGLNLRSAPSLSAPVVGHLADGADLLISCQTTGDRVGHSTIWDRVAGGYLTDWFTTTPGVGRFTVGIPQCAANTGPAPAPAPAPAPPPAPQPGRAWGATTGSNTMTSGQCTWWAMQEFHGATGVYPALHGDAHSWAASARRTGWSVATDPAPRSVVVFPANFDGASGYGHVAWVEQVQRRSSGTWIRISEMNGPAGPYRVDHRWVRHLPGLSYILAP